MRETPLSLQGIGFDGSQVEIARASFARRSGDSLIDAKQPLDATLTALAALTIAADSLTVGTGTDAFNQTSFPANTFPAKSSAGALVAKTLTDFALTILDDADAPTVRATIGAGTGNGTVTDVTGTAPIASSGGVTPAISLNANGITDAKLRQGAALTVIGRSANSLGNVADIAATAASGAVLRESGSTIGFGTVATAGIAANAADNTIIRDSGALSVIGRSANSSGDPADIAAAAASDAVLRESGSVLGFGTIATAGIANDAVTYAKMQNVSAASKLLGRGSAAGAGDPEEITLGTNLSMSGTTLNAAASAVSMTQTTIDFGSTAVDHKTFTINDAAVQATSKLIVSVYDTADTDENAEGMDALTFVTRPAAGSFKLHALVPDGKLVRGIFKIQYLIAA